MQHPFLFFSTPRLLRRIHKTTRQLSQYSNPRQKDKYWELFQATQKASFREIRRLPLIQVYLPAIH